MTRDHSLVQELLEQGKISDEDAKHHPQKNLITRAVGVESKVCIDYLETMLNAEDKVLICTDGLSNNCEASVLHRMVAVSYTHLLSSKSGILTPFCRMFIWWICGGI